MECFSHDIGRKRRENFAADSSLALRQCFENDHCEFITAASCIGIGVLFFVFIIASGSDFCRCITAASHIGIIGIVVLCLSLIIARGIGIVVLCIVFVFLVFIVGIPNSNERAWTNVETTAKGTAERSKIAKTTRCTIAYRIGRENRHACSDITARWNAKTNAKQTFGSKHNEVQRTEGD